MGYAERVEVIYCKVVHNMTLRQISNSRNVKYNTVRHILSNYYDNGRVNIKEKITGYKKKSKKTVLLDKSETDSSLEKNQIFEEKAASNSSDEMSTKCPSTSKSQLRSDEWQ